MSRPGDGIINYPAKPKRDRKASDEEIKAALLEKGSISAAAKSLGMNRATIQDRLERMRAAGDLVRPRVESNPSRWRPGAEIVAARKAEFARVYASRPGADGNVIHLPDNLPFMLVVLGDEHLDNPGTDLDEFERWISFLDRGKHRTGISMGDMLDNWARVLAHLYAKAETTSPEAWILFEHYMEEIGDGLDASVGGNHDAWSGASDILAHEMERRGVLHRNASLQWAYRTPEGREIGVKARHKWPGNSMYNEVHAIKRAAKFGDRHHIMLGGHTHVSGYAVEKCPKTGFLSHCCQAAAFKRIDDYADDEGFQDKNISPGMALVIDPRRADQDAELCKQFWDPEPAAAYLAMLRRAAKTKSIA